MIRIKELKDYLYNSVDHSILKDEQESGRLIKILPSEEDNRYLLEGEDDKWYKLTARDVEKLALNNFYHLRKDVLFCPSLTTYYKTPRSAAEHMNVSDTTVYNIVKMSDNKPFEVRGLKFEIIDAVLTDQDLIHPVPYFAEPVKKPVPTAKKSVLCVETGDVFESVSQAAEFAGVSRGYLGQLIKKGKQCKSKTFKYIE